jgi:hypothetical protein
VEAAERTVYKKILAAHLASARHPRLSVDDFLRPLLAPEERATEAYDTYDYLQGRTPEFRAFLVSALGYADEEAARRELEAEYGEALRGRLAWYEQTGR